MTKVIQFPGSSPEKFGFKPVRKKRKSTGETPGQLDLFSGGKMRSLHPLSVFEEALMLDEEGDNRARVREHYLKAVESGDSVADAYCNLGILESEEHHNIQAIDYFTKSLKEDPRHYEAHYNLANLYADIGDLPLAKIHYQMAITIEPEFPNSYFNLALTLAMNKEVEEAIKALLTYRDLVSQEDRKQAEQLINTLTYSLR